jgi:hypothetical protein
VRVKDQTRCLRLCGAALYSKLREQLFMVKQRVKISYCDRGGEWCQGFSTLTEDRDGGHNRQDLRLEPHHST